MFAFLNLLCNTYDNNFSHTMHEQYTLKISLLIKINTFFLKKSPMCSLQVIDLNCLGIAFMLNAEVLNIP